IALLFGLNRFAADGPEVQLNRNGWVSALILVALGATHQAVTPGTSSGGRTLSAGGTRPVQSETTDICAALRARYSLSGPPPAKGSCLPADSKVLFVIATAPNPANSQLALSF